MNAITFNAPRGRTYQPPSARELADNLRQIEFDEERRLQRITNRLAYQDHLTRVRNAKWYRRWWMSAIVWPLTSSLPPCEHVSLTVNMAALIIDYLYSVTNTDSTRADYLCKDAFARHDAIANLLKDFAVTVTFFPELRNLNRYLFTRPQLAPHRQN